MPCETDTAHKVQRKHFFSSICPCVNDIAYVSFEGFRAFLKVFMGKCTNHGQLRTIEKRTERTDFQNEESMQRGRGMWIRRN